MQNYAVAKGTPRGPRREGPYDQGYVCSSSRTHSENRVDITQSKRHCQLTSNGVTTPSPHPLSPLSMPLLNHNHRLRPLNLTITQPPLNPPYSRNCTLLLNRLHKTSITPNSSITSTGTANTNNTLPSIPQQSNTGAGMTDQSSLTSISHEGWVPPGIPASTGATFGVDLGEQLLRDGAVVPKIVEKCTQAIEMYGLESVGVYRLSGTTSRVQALKAALDKGSCHQRIQLPKLISQIIDVDAVDILSDEWSADINVVCGALKLWFRELPEPLLTYGLYNAFIEAARKSSTIMV